ncbi:(2E,6E)-farnesyl diphosphate synthase [Photorhabdus laumondii subsp. laumondii]|uniref:Geranyltranstransferase (Farnesyl-diphosphate synthase) FPP synthase n=2 Tax=Photorhabdus laumondii subsp. laumondii TaxID=141679 RepID=Q7MBH1_PHOLL|nr:MULTISPECIES: (2E,6E)-farnesyl diphosphate synthase [Photorhabdus]AWK43493.1 geranyl transferase [Photorhabdus laumondii subsp. laumondii]AXG44171.1 (2E,6E)-farnesyl diphosphate synthase [Photorhabdus laumondii subsp. laumondii]AXG48799.1 (2E,6E)-farnesyl diphosphate synthase [Photorhabdus laumondii subsp. laumondii]KTL63411.1 geranyl transferase [Photorhabdus laumondii subsp. laumondii]MCC8382682.1 (2E,6E)-farnesyl diphosphate synthase [Photorhabdus laumondii]
MSEQNSTQFKEQLKICQQRVNNVLISTLSSVAFANNPLVHAMQHGTLLGGKRLRPFLVYAVGEMFGLSANNLDAPAAAVECIHAFSLIHDDLPAMDNDDLRRGQPTCHIKFGEAHAILAGDALQALAFEILSKREMPDVTTADRLEMVAELATASGIAGMCGGQALDLAAEGRHIDLHMLEQIHRHKTGALIRCAVRMGAYGAGQSGHDALPELDQYAQAIGLAFQVQDDILDVIGDTEMIGKRQGSDQQLGKSTYPALLGLEQAQKKAYELYQEALKALNKLEDKSYNTTMLRALASFIIERNN